MRPAQKILTFFSLILIGFSSISSPVLATPIAQTSQTMTTCKGEAKTWDQIDAELTTAGYDGSLDHTDAELSAYNRTACPTQQGSAVSPENYHAPEHSSYTILNLETAAIPCTIIGTTVVKGQTCTGYNKKGELALYQKLPDGGALGGLNKVMLAMYNNPPTSTTEYLADLGHQIGLAKPAYAQTPNIGGSGDGVIAPIMQLWKVSRNLAYLGFIIVFVVVGFMIMFRTKINPQTVISAQAALPSLVIGLILVTFSYFISALIIDFSFISMKLVAAFFAASNLNNTIGDANQINEIAQKNNIFSIFGSFAWNSDLLGSVITGVGRVFADLSNNLFAPVIKAPLSTGFPDVFGLAKTALGLNSIFGLLGGTLGFLLVVVIMIALLIQMFKLIFALVTSYISVLVVTILSPLIILIASVPGKSGVLALWWKSLLGNILVFPAVFAAFLFAGIILGSTNAEDFKQTLPLFGGLDPGILRIILAYGIILGSPAIPGMVKKAIGVPDIAGIPQAAAAGIGSGAAPFISGGTAGIKEIWGRTRGLEREANRRAQIARRQRDIAQGLGETGEPHGEGG